MIPLKNEQELQLMRTAGRILAGILLRLQEEIKPGITTAEIDRLAEELMRREDVAPAFKGYNGYPATVCASVNEVVVHGIPGPRKLAQGDIIGLDAGIRYRSVYSDIAATLAVGEVDGQARTLIEATRQSLAAGIRAMQPGSRLSDISHAVQQEVERYGFSVVRQFVGHGIGQQLHEEPEIPNFGLPGKGPRLQKGMVFAIEPMVNAGSWECEILDDGWTAVTRDGRLSAHFEHTVALTETGPEILTRP